MIRQGNLGRERVLRVLRGEATDRLPVLCVNQTATYAQMERLGVSWPEANFQAAPMAELAAGAHFLLGFDAVRLPFCQTIEAEVMGAVLKDGGRLNLPSILEHPCKIDDARITVPDDFLERGRIPQLLEGISRLKQMVGARALVIGGIIGPYSTAGNLLGTTDLLRQSFRQPEKLTKFLEAGAEIGAILAKALVGAGADAICVEDMVASMDMISPTIYRTLILPWHHKLLADLPAVPVIMHICGKLDEVILDIAGTGVAAISVEEKVDAAVAVKRLADLGRPVALIGGVSAVHTLYAGTVDQVKAAVRQASKEGYQIIAPGCGIPPATPMENLRAMVEAVEAETAQESAS